MNGFDPIEFFLNPKTARQKQYDALRDYYLNKLTQINAAEKYGYKLTTFQTLVRDFKSQKVVFFLPVKKGPKSKRMPNSIRDEITALRKKNHSIYDIQEQLEQKGFSWSRDSINKVLKEEGFAKLHRRTRRELGLTKKRTIIPPTATQLKFDTLTNYRFECQVGGIYYFIPYILKTNLYEQLVNSSLPETSKLSKVNSIFSILALKLMGHERLSKISTYNLDTGFGFFAGLNVPPKTQATSTYSHRVDQQSIQTFLESFISNMNKNFSHFYQGETINLDFHSIPHYGEQSQLDKHWVGAKHQSLKSASTFLAQDGESRMLVYENSNIDAKTASDEILNFVKYWLRIKGIIDQTLVFDCKLTTYSRLEELAGEGIKFITLRHRGAKLIEKALNLPKDAWETVDLKKKKRKHNRFKIHEEYITLPRTNLEVRQLIFKDHGRESPTFLITNNDDWDLETIALNYANRWLIENKISEIVDFFKLNALSSPFLIRIYLDVALTVIADTLYRLLSHDLKGFEVCTPKTIFSDFINCGCKGVVEGNNVVVKMKKKKTSPIFKSSEIYRTSYEVPWWGNKTLSYDWVA